MGAAGAVHVIRFNGMAPGESVPGVFHLFPHIGGRRTAHAALWALDPERAVVSFARGIERAARGVSVMPAEYRGGPLAFDRDNGFDALGAVSSVSAAWREAAQKLPDMLPDTRRFRALSDAELADVAACRRQEARMA